MKSIFVVATLLLISVYAEAKPLALVYNGIGACQEGDCAGAAAKAARHAGFKVKFVSESQITPQTFANVQLWVQPGGNAIELAQAISVPAQEEIKKFVYTGGSYLGLCAGGYFAAKEIDTGVKGLGFLEGEVDDLTDEKNGMVVLALWFNKFRYLYIEEAPFFNPVGPIEKPFAHYSNGKVAALETRFGQGRVVVTGPHPEAPTEWPEAFNVVDPDGNDFDLAIDLFSKFRR